MKKIAGVLGAAVVAVLISPTNAATLTLGHDDLLKGSDFGYTHQSCNSPSGEIACIADVFGILDSTDLELLYKANAGGSDENDFADDYTTIFTPAGDPKNATVTWDGLDTIACPSCYLFVKDGNNSPFLYFYDLSNWDGTETINLVGLFPTGGGISHVTIIGGDAPCERNCTPGDQVPEPATLALLGLGLLGAGVVRRRR